jgi:hypothetical protein
MSTVEVNTIKPSTGNTTTFSNTTESSSSTTGAVVISGGVGIAKNVNIAGTLSATTSILPDKASISSGSGAPSSTPEKIGDLYVDTINKLLYTADGNSSSANWVIQSPASKIGMMTTSNWADVSWGKDNVGATRFMAYQTGYVSTIAMWINSNTSGTKVKCALYANYSDSSRPNGAPLTISDEVTLDGVAMKIWLFDFSTPYKITKGTNYWLAFNFGTYNSNPMRIGTSAIPMCQYWSQSYNSGNSFLTISGAGTNEKGIAMFGY